MTPFNLDGDTPLLGQASVAAFDDNFGANVKNQKTSYQKTSANTLRIRRVQIRCVYAAYTQRICTFFCVDSHLYPYAIS